MSLLLSRDKITIIIIIIILKSVNHGDKLFLEGHVIIYFIILKCDLI